MYQFEIIEPENDAVQHFFAEKAKNEQLRLTMNTDWKLIEEIEESVNENQENFTHALTSQRLYIVSELDSIESVPYMSEIDLMELNDENDIESEYSDEYIDTLDIEEIENEIAYFENQKKQFSSFQATAERTHHDDLVEHYNRLRKICIVTLKALKMREICTLFS